MTSPKHPPIEFWAIYRLEGGSIRTSGWGATGEGPKQELFASEALYVGERTDPNLHKIVSGPDGQPQRANL